MRSNRLTLLLAATTIAGMSLSACSTAAPEGDSAQSATCPNGAIKFGIEPYEDPAKLEPAYRVLADALSEQLDCAVELTIVDDYAAQVIAMQNGKLDIGQFGPIGYVFAKEKAGAEAVASFGTADGKLSTYTAGIWVPKDSSISSIDDLPGHSLALGAVGSTSGDVLPRYALAKAKIAESAVTSNYAGGHPEALLALVNGTVDAAEINSQTLASASAAGTFNPSDYRQVWTSQPIPNDPVTVRGDADPKFKAAVKQALLGLSTQDIAQVGEFLDVSPAGPMIEVDDETYSAVFDLADIMGLTEDDV